MIRVLLIIAAAIVVVSVAIILLAVLGVIVFSAACIFGTEFDEFGEIHECVGCRGWERSCCEGCRQNPKYWNKTKYIGPSRRKLRKIRREHSRGEEKET